MFSNRQGLKRLAVGAAAFAVALSACGGGTASPAASAAASSGASNDIVAQAKQFVADQLSAKAGWDGPASGPKAQAAGKTIVFVGADLTNGGIAALSDGVKEAAGVIGWEVKIIDGKASADGRTQAMNQAIALKPAGIILGGFDAAEQKTAIQTAAGQKIPVVGWHAGSKAGPDTTTGLFTNVTTDPLQVSKMAADYAIADSDGKAGVVIFTDSQYQIAVDKANAIQDEIKKCSTCTVLSYEDSPIAEAQQKMPPLVASLLQKNGDKLTYLLAINGNYFAGSRAALIDAGKKGTDAPYAVAAGDGDAAEFQRIRDGDYQKASVAEPLYLQAWQLVDELNRAVAGEKDSAYVAPPGLITKETVPTGNVFDPKSAYRENYKKIWGK
jgi:ribose transport system substrate-binding protein